VNNRGDTALFDFFPPGARSRAFPGGSERGGGIRPIPAIPGHCGAVMKSPYNGEYRRARRRLLAGGRVCWVCGEPATEVDHLPPLVMHRHLGVGRGCCTLLPMCARCARWQGAKLRGR
jgi:hypothetical protein